MGTAGRPLRRDSVASECTAGEPAAFALSLAGDFDGLREADVHEDAVEFAKGASAEELLAKLAHDRDGAIDIAEDLLSNDEPLPASVVLPSLGELFLRTTPADAESRELAVQLAERFDWPDAAAKEQLVVAVSYPEMHDHPAEPLRILAAAVVAGVDTGNKEDAEPVVTAAEVVRLAAQIAGLEGYAPEHARPGNAATPELLPAARDLLERDVIDLRVEVVLTGPKPAPADQTLVTLGLVLDEADRRRDDTSLLDSAMRLAAELPDFLPRARQVLLDRLVSTPPPASYVMLLQTYANVAAAESRPADQTPPGPAPRTPGEGKAPRTPPAHDARRTDGNGAARER